MLKLIHHPLSAPSRKIRLQLAEKDLEFQLELEKPWERREAFLLFNPAGEVPVLLAEDGTPIADATAISELLEEVSHLLVHDVEKAAATAEGPHAQVRAGFAAYFRFVDQRRSAFQLLFLGDSRHDRVLTAAVDQLEAAMADAIAPLIEAGIGPKQRRQLAMALIGMAEATGRRALIDDDLVGPDGLEAMAGRLAELAWSGLRGIRPEVGPGPMAETAP